MFTDMLAARSISSFAGGLVAAQDGRCNKNRVNHPPKTPCKFQEMHFSSFFDSSLNFSQKCSFQCCNGKLGKNCPFALEQSPILWTLKTAIPVIQMAGCWSIIVSGKALAAEALKKPKKAKNRRIMYYKRQGHPK